MINSSRLKFFESIKLVFFKKSNKPALANFASAFSNSFNVAIA